MNTPTPQVSVVMAVYNAGAYLSPAIDSILTQGFSDFELLVVDDGSTDGSSGILDSYTACDPRMRVIHQENAGLTRACRTAVKQARGTYVARMDTDDIAWSDRLSIQVAAMDANPALLALGTHVRLIDPEGRPLKVLDTPQSHDAIDGAHISGNGQSMICHPTVMMRTDAVRQVGNYNPKFQAAQDIDLFLRLAEVGRVGNLPNVLLDYRQHVTSVGYAKRARQIADAWQAVQDAAVRRGLTLDATTAPQVTDTQTQGEIWRKWGWWALSDGHVATARHYAHKLLRAAPFSKKNWHFAAMAWRGY
ncbi:glycosyltransferase family 2 protein [Tateyamaria sp.]|uniref:glycosyltransferase family 2 protein n=1 Tax=Tateyamaria sp. TaxID=1929288 RepID=UPI00329ED5A2